MDGRIGKVSRQGVVLFALGVLVGALVLGGGVWFVHGQAETTIAQDQGAWRAEPFVCRTAACDLESFYTADLSTTMGGFLATLPSSCQLEPMLMLGGERLTLFYSC